MTHALNEWRNFRNGTELLSQFENQQIINIFRKFVKQACTSNYQISSFEKLINMAQNLVKAHLSSLNQYKN